MDRKALEFGVVGLCAAMLAALSAGPGAAATLLGEAQKMGRGTVRATVELDAGGHPSAIGVILSANALMGLPPLKNATSMAANTEMSSRAG